MALLRDSVIAFFLAWGIGTAVRCLHRRYFSPGGEPMEHQSTVEGTVQSVIFENEDNGYTVLTLLCDDTGEVVTAVGCLPQCVPGEHLALTGAWTEHPSYGSQLTVDAAERRMPETEDEILAFLSSGAVKGVGPSTAAKLVQRFGADTLWVMEHEPEKLKAVKGITAPKAAEMAEQLRARMALRRVMDFLTYYDLPASMAVALLRAFGPATVDRLKTNPYLLVDERFGVPFSTADEIAIALGIGGEDERRLEAALTYELSHNLGNGHVFLPREKLLAATAALVDVAPDAVEAALDTMIDRHAFCQSAVGKVTGCYLRSLYEAETAVAQRLLTMAHDGADALRSPERAIDELQRQAGITYAPAQRQAMALAAERGVVLLTGGPGTGKTTAVRGIVALFDRMGLTMALLAPTGRAAKRMTEVTGREAQTVHRALGMSFNELTGETAFRKCEKDPLECEAVIVDEMSMVDLPLMDALLRAMRPGTRLVMVGDADQLPSVGPGNVLSDLLRSGVIPAVRLTEVFRQAQNSAIIRNAYLVNSGVSPELKNGSGDFFFLCRRSPERLVQTVVELVAQRLPGNMHIPSSDIQVLTPTRKGEWGTANLNRVLQAALNPPAPGKREKRWGDVVFRTGDRVMQTRNNYDVVWERDNGEVGTGIFNGDLGIIEEISADGELLSIRFDDRLSTYTSDLLNQLELAYAITVHKSQGSEYRCVVLVSAPVAPALQVRGVLYTAITRARELLVLVGDDVIPGQMAANDKPQRRYSGLRRRLKEGAQ